MHQTLFCGFCPGLVTVLTVCNSTSFMEIKSGRNRLRDKLTLNYELSIVINNSKFHETLIIFISD